MGPGVSSAAARRLRVVGAVVVLVVLATAPLERWYLTRRANAMHARIVAIREAAAARQPAGWQADTLAARAVADLEYHRAHVRRRLAQQWTSASGTVWLLVAGGILVLVGSVAGMRQTADGR